MPKLTPPITVKALREMKPGEELADGGCPGLRARAGAGGVCWSVMVREAGVRRRVEVGAWPEIGVPQARERAAKLKAGAVKPKGDLLALDELITTYGRERGAARISWPDAERRIRSVFAPLLGSTELTLEALQRTADAHPARSSAGAAVRYLKPILKWGAKRRYVSRIDDLEQPVRVQKRDRVLTEDELRRVLGALGAQSYDGAARFILLTALRREEACALRFEDIIEDVAEVRLKGGRTMLLPLSVDAQGVIGAQGRTSGLVFVNARGEALNNWDKWQKRIFEKTGTAGWHRHDLRRTAATLLGREGVLPHVIEMALGHKHAHSDLASIYNQSRYEREHLDALELLSGILRRIEG